MIKKELQFLRSVSNKTKSYRNDNDIVGQWISQACQHADNKVEPNGSEFAPSPFDNLFYEYKTWCSKGHKVPDKKNKRRLTQMARSISLWFISW